jgi:DNA-binding beta-propeller fold protein YncE
MAGLMAAGLLTGTAALAASGFVINSDDPSPRDFDSLHRVELSSGQAVKVGAVRVSDSAAPFADVEGLAMSPNGTLYGIDDASKTLITIDVQSGRGFPVNGRDGNTGLPRTTNFDFGLTFDCNGDLYASSDSRRSLYRIDTGTGVATLVGTEGALGAQITGLAARLDGVYGIGSSGDENLYRIDTSTGRATLIGPLGANLQFTDGGLDFDAAGQLWGIADLTGSSINAEPSVVFRIDIASGAATRIGITLPGVESLAITAPVCTAPEGDPLPPAIPTLGGPGLGLLGMLLALLGMVALRPTQR